MTIKNDDASKSGEPTITIDLDVLRLKGHRIMGQNCFLKPASTHNSSIRTDLPLTVVRRKKRKLIEKIRTGQLLCVGKVYLKTHNGIIRIN
jgi:hypothetical protein